MSDCSTLKVVERTLREAEELAKADQLIDDNFASFDIISPIGLGAFAKVVLARRRYNSTLCALKIMSKHGSIAHRTRLANTFHVEKNILAGLNHPNIVKLWYTIENEKAYVLVMEYCAGGDLFSHILLQNKLSEQTTRFYAAQIALGLNYLHSSGVIYRDLKPENLFLTKSGYLRFGDFGLSIPIIPDAREARYGQAGTTEFFAPEIAANSEYGQSVDWWSFGCVVYFMMTGKYPFRGETRSKLLENIQTVEPEYPETLSLEAKDLLQLAFAKDASKRLDGRTVLSHPWFQDFQWDLLTDEKMTAPFVPALTSDEDVSSFDKEFTSLAVENPFEEK